MSPATENDGFGYSDGFGHTPLTLRKELGLERLVDSVAKCVTRPHVPRRELNCIPWSELERDCSSALSTTRRSEFTSMDSQEDEDSFLRCMLLLSS
jgi:hypothetical protein